MKRQDPMVSMFQEIIFYRVPRVGGGVAENLGRPWVCLLCESEVHPFERELHAHLHMVDGRQRRLWPR